MGDKDPNINKPSKSFQDPHDATFYQEIYEAYFDPSLPDDLNDERLLQFIDEIDHEDEECEDDDY